MPFYVCALPNKKGTAAPLELICDDQAKIEAWARRHDREGWGIYTCHNPLKPGATRRSKETIAEVREIVVDIDPKDVVETMDEVDVRLNGLLLPPSELRDSGRGRHVVFWLKDPVSTDDQEMIAGVDAVRERLTEILCGDRQVIHQAALFRRRGVFLPSRAAAGAAITWKALPPCCNRDPRSHRPRGHRSPRRRPPPHNGLGGGQENAMRRGSLRAWVARLLVGRNRHLEGPADSTLATSVPI
jgi:hypothetical protein